MRNFALLLLLAAARISCGDAFTPPDPSFVHTISHTSIAFVKHEAHNIANLYNDALHQFPLATKMLTGGTLATAGDAIAQSKIKEEPYDKRRAASFMTFDMAYRALQHVLYPIVVASCHGQHIQHLLPHNMIVSNDLLAGMEETAVAQLAIVPLFYYPVFFGLTGFLQGLSPGASLDRAKEMFIPLMQRNLLFWIPVQFIQFTYIDEQLQIPFLSVAGLCWTFMLSAVAGSAAKTASSPNASTPQEQLDEQVVVEEDDINDQDFAVPSALVNEKLTANTVSG